MNKLVSCAGLFCSLSLVFSVVVCDENSARMSNFAVASYYDLDDCTSELEGNSVYVKMDMISYVCEDGRWVDEGGNVKVEESSASKKCRLLR